MSKSMQSRQTNGSEVAYTQCVDKKRLFYVLNHLNEFGIGKAFCDGRTINDVQAVRTLYLKLYEALDTDGNVSIVYRQKNGRGRLWPQEPFGITSLARVARAHVAGARHIDIDIKNCHIVFYLKLCADHELASPRVREYVDRRDELVAADPGLKQQVLKALNGGVCQRPSKLLRDIEAEFARNRELILADHPDIVRDVEATSNYNVLGKAFNRLLIDMEVKSLWLMADYIASVGGTVTSLAYDGLTLERTPASEAALGEWMRGVGELLSREVAPGLVVLEKSLAPAEPLPQTTVDAFYDATCRCRLDHKTVGVVADRLVAYLKVSSADDADVRLVAGFVAACTDTRKCVRRHLNKALCALDGFDLDDVDDYAQLEADLVSVGDALKSALKGAKYEKERTACERLVRDRAAGQAVAQTETQLAPVAKRPFVPEDDAFRDFMERYRVAVFPDQAAMHQDFAANFERFFKRVQFPECYYVNMGRGRQEVVARSKVSLRTQCVYQTKDGPVRRGVDMLRQLECDNALSAAVPMYKRATFNPDPRVDDPSDYNTYPGFQASVVPDVDHALIAPILNHIKYSWADGSEEVYNYLLMWFRHIFVTPWEKTGTVPVLFGKEGTGKGVLIDNLFIKYVFGDSMATMCAGIGPIVQRFNSICMDKLFIGCNEVSGGGGFHEGLDKLKTLITDPTMTIEKKGIDIFKEYPNRLNFIFMTNWKLAVSITKTDRRYVPMETSTRFVGDYEYFEKLVATCTQQAADHLFTYISSLPKMGTIKRIPTTALKDEMVQLSLNSVARFAEVITTSPPSTYLEAISTDASWDSIIRASLVDGSQFIPARQLFAAYKAWCHEFGEKAMSNTAFGREVKEHLEFKRTKSMRGYRVIYPDNEAEADDAGDGWAASQQ